MSAILYSTTGEENEKKVHNVLHKIQPQVSNCPQAEPWYSPRGTSADMLSVTVGDRGVALVKKFRYLRAKVSWTGSFISIVTWGSRPGSGKDSRAWHSSGKGHP